ncbi:hypothetical protein JTE90_007834 [Oedothorax gibbosus]|uniref:HTH CENPB-type domain-containing protein n=1 Tax=Oedothorax gibbosus TaxID=931172 RepID=A0AAV6VK91_9ARAC|nr:hypothetical protein JTE90_007834 [Oedothorax gibbosus]
MLSQKVHLGGFCIQSLDFDEDVESDHDFESPSCIKELQEQEEENMEDSLSDDANELNRMDDVPVFENAPLSNNEEDDDSNDHCLLNPTVLKRKSEAFNDSFEKKFCKRDFLDDDEDSNSQNESDGYEPEVEEPSVPVARKIIPIITAPAPPDLEMWLAKFQEWSNLDRLSALDRLIDVCDPAQVRHMMNVIEPQFQRDFISLLPKEVVLRAEEANNMVAAREFGVNKKSVRVWRKLKGVLKKSKKTAKAARGKAAQFPDLDKAVLTWVLERRQNGHIVTRTAIRLKALHLAKTVVKTHPGASFVASAGWCSRFMERHGLSLRQRTKIAQKLPKQLEEKIVAFQKEVINLRKENNFELSQIGNMDETPMTFDIPINRTVNAKGDKTVLIKTTGHEKTHFTVVLTCMADGTKLKPVVIFKRKRLPKNVKFAAGVIVRPQAKGWMDEDGVVDWISKVLDQIPGPALGKKSLLVWDSFRAHLTDKMKEKVKESLRTSQVVIPGGLTSILQPLDVCINKPFKDRMKM